MSEVLQPHHATPSSCSQCSTRLTSQSFISLRHHSMSDHAMNAVDFIAVKAFTRKHPELLTAANAPHTASHFDAMAQ